MHIVIAGTCSLMTSSRVAGGSARLVRRISGSLDRSGPPDPPRPWRDAVACFGWSLTGRQNQNCPQKPAMPAVVAVGFLIRPFGSLSLWHLFVLLLVCEIDSLGRVSYMESLRPSDSNRPDDPPASMQEGLSFPVCRGKDRSYRSELNEFTGTSRAHKRSTPAQSRSVRPPLLSPPVVVPISKHYIPTPAG